jgi:transcription-repair coupling factor (superfamily II helicase)
MTLRFKLTGVCPPARGAVLAELLLTHAAPVWLVVASELRTAETLAEDIAFFHGAAGGKPPPEVLIFPESLPDSRDMREAFAASSDRLTVLSKLRARRNFSGSLSRRSSEGAKADRLSTPDSRLSALLILTTPAALLQSVPTLEAFATHELTLTRGQRQPFQELLEKLHAIDYDSEAVCEAPGHYAIRGGIIDVYPVTATQPYRLDFFGDEIESIKAFDPVTQRSGEAVESIALAASPRIKLDPAKSGLADYLTPLAHLALIEPASLDEAFDVIARDGGPSPVPLLEKCAAVFGVGDLDESSVLFDSAGTEQTWDT